MNTDLKSDNSSSSLLLGAGIAAALGSMTSLMISPYLGLHAKSLAAPATIIGIILAVRNYTQILFRVPLGKLSDSYGRVSLIRFGFMMYATACLLLFLGPTWHFVLLATFFIGIGMSAIWPSLLALAGDASPDQIGRATGKILRMNDIGAFLAPLIGGLVLDIPGSTYRWVFATAMALAFIGLLSIGIILHEPIENTKEMNPSNFMKDLKENVKNGFSDAGKAMAVKSLLYAYIIAFFVAMAGNATFNYVPFLMKENHIPDPWIGYIFASFTVPVMIVKVWLGSRVDYLGFKKTTGISLVLAGLAIYFTALSKTPLEYFSSLTLLFASMSIAYPAFNQLVSKESKGIIGKGIAIGTLGIYVSIGRGTSNLLVGLLWSHIPLKEAFYLMAATIFIIGILVLIFPSPYLKEVKSDISTTTKN